MLARSAGSVCSHAAWVCNGFAHCLLKYPNPRTRANAATVRLTVSEIVHLRAFRAARSALAALNNHIPRKNTLRMSCSSLACVAPNSGAILPKAGSMVSIDIATSEVASAPSVMNWRSLTGHVCHFAESAPSRRPGARSASGLSSRQLPNAGQILPQKTPRARARPAVGRSGQRFPQEIRWFLARLLLHVQQRRHFSCDNVDWAPRD